MADNLSREGFILAMFDRIRQLDPVSVRDAREAVALVRELGAAIDGKEPAYFVPAESDWATTPEVLDGRH